MKALLPITLFVILAITLGGCQQNPEAKLIGSWTSSGAGGPSSRSTLVIKDDKTFTMGSGQQTAAGRWSLAEKTLTLNIDTVGGKPKEEAIKDLEARVGQLSMVPPEKKAEIDKAMAEAKALLTEMKLTVGDDAKSLTANIQNTKLKFNKNEG